MIDKFDIIRMLYKVKKLDAKAVWAAADDGKITEKQAAEICGAREKESEEEEQ